MEQWMSGPMADQDIGLLGVKVFWWNRLLILSQVLLAGSLLFTLLKEHYKTAFAEWLGRQADASARIPRPKAARFGRWVANLLGLVLLVATGLATIVGLQNAASWSEILKLATGLAVLLALLMIPLVLFGLAMMSGLREGWWAARRTLPPMAHWAFGGSRFDLTVNVMAFVGLFLVTIGQLAIS